VTAPPASLIGTHGTSNSVYPLVLLLKSYRQDFDYARRLVTSFHQHNPEQIPLVCVVPPEDVELFSELLSPSVTVLDERVFHPYFTAEPVHGIRPGYINQEIVKLAFWELGIAQAYFCIDSDAVILRDLRMTDFLAPDGTPYTVLVEDNELKVEPRYFREYWSSREQSLHRIAEEVGLRDPILRTCHGHQVMSTTVLGDFVEQFLKPRNWTYLDALRVSPYEFSWYNFWLQAHTPIKVHTREPLVKVFHHEGQHLEYILRGITAEDMSRGYLAAVINSNYARDLGLIALDEAKPEALAPYLSFSELGRLFASKIRGSLRRRT
jgi:hypothetical protein